MRKRKPFHSLRFRMYMIVAILFICVAVLLILNSLFAVNTLREQICSASEDTLAISQKRLDDTFQRAFTYLLTFTTQPTDVQQLEQASQATTDYYTAIARLIRQYNNSAATYGVESFFYCDADRNLYFANLNDIFIPIRPKVIELAKSPTTAKWVSFEVENVYYLLRMVKIGSGFVGAWSRVDYALNQIHDDHYQGNEVYLLDQSGQVMAPNAPIDTLPITKGEAPYTFVTIGHQQFLVVTQKAAFGDFYLAMLLPDTAIFSNLNRYMVTAFTLAAILFIIFVFGITLVHRLIMKPISNLTNAIRALQEGDFQATLPQSTYEEFIEVNSAFNTATQKIKTLKIDMYEEQLKKQEIQMQYLQLQIAPHFLINCLNTVYQLADTDQHELTRSMLLTLSRHLRYTLSADKIVSLGEELQHVENYIALSAIRYPNSVFLITDYDSAVLNANAIPLLVLNFVENTIKYEAILGKRLEIHISAQLYSIGTKPYVHLCIWDTGGGFSPDILADLQDIPSFIQKYKGTHIGISNVFQRAMILFEDCDCTFCNRPDAGAQIDIILPYIPFGQKEAEK